MIYGSTEPTDYYYTTMDINPFSSNNDTSGILDYSDIFGSRISVDDTVELRTVLNKIIDYEKNPYIEQTEWYNTINLSAEYEYLFEVPPVPPGSYCDCIENVYFLYTSYMLGEYFDDFYNIDKVFHNDAFILHPEWDTICWEWAVQIPQGIPFIENENDATDAVIQSINSGCFLVNHRDHGESKNAHLDYVDGWSHPAFDSSHISQLNNDKMLPVMFSLNCMTGWFDGATETQMDTLYWQYQTGNFDCFGELLLSKENGGVVGFIGATRNTKSGYNDELCYGMFDAIWDEFDPFNNEIQTPIYKLGAIKEYGLLYMFNKYFLRNATTNYNYPLFTPTGLKNRKQFEKFHVLGDPTLEIWTDVPQPLYAYVNFDDNSVTIYDENDQVIPDAKVVFQYGPEETEDYEVKMTDINGKVYSNLLNNFNVEVSAIKHNYIPWYSTIISDNTTWPVDEDVRGNIIIANNGNLTFAEDITIPKYARIIVMEGGTFTTNTNTDISFSNGYNDLLVYGQLNFGQNTSFAMTGSGQGKIELLNESMAYSFNNIDFNSFYVSGNPLSISFNSSHFLNSILDIEEANVTIATSEFSGSYVNIIRPRTTYSYAHIVENCKFYETINAIYIEGYHNYIISNVEVYNCQEAIQIFNSGGAASENTISHNNIHNNSGTGLSLYRTHADVLHNQFNENGFGIKSLNRSVVHLEGDSHDVTQEIKDNTNAEVYATRGSFPQYFRWNLVQDDYNQANDPMVLYDGAEEGLDVRYNCWGNTFSPENDLSPAASYTWNPVWECELGEGNDEGSEAESMYFAARTDIENENYASAQTTYQNIVVQHPNTKYAQAALKELYSLEKLVNNDYTSLKSYYTSEQAIVNNPSLAQLADFLVNFCEIKLENYPTAIAWFENVIQNPNSMEDSIFAIIDLGYTYYLMENGGLKSSYTGTMAEHKPVSEKQFDEKRDFLLSLIPQKKTGNDLYKSLSELKPGELLQNIPNPFTGSTQIWYKLENEALVQLKIYNNTGQLIEIIDDGNKAEGLHHIDFDASGLTVGTYYYSISINGLTTDSKKMTIMK